MVMTNNAAKRIQQARCNCWTTMQITFPAMPYVTLALLAMAICISFLVATDPSQVIFESLQPRETSSASATSRLRESFWLFYDKHHSTLPNTATLASLHTAAQAL
jgi:fucose permease